MHKFTKKYHGQTRQPYHGSGDNQGQETFLAPCTDKQIHNYDTECSKQYPSQSP